MIEFNKVTKVYQQNWTGLSDISVKITKGEFIFVYGPSGAGKSTFLKLIYLEEKPTTGVV
ncbi:MAG TPA: ATP-binding cassette domain-containing protein, partial [bacterium (Candidatus Stahlbacteria)]|nr:ATP-binding cassette domain-containing protein [Candidatus Stahlbacteria bacterium]